MNKCIYTLALIIAVLAFQACQTDTNVTEKAAKIHNKVLTVDTHTDSPLNLMHSDFEMGEKHSYKETPTCLDFPRMKEGGLDVAFLAVFIGQRDRTPIGAATS